jgi:septal ring factor EnvC (AmiA/AmiB activator)
MNSNITDDDTDTPDATAVPPAPEERAFELLAALIALIVDPKAVEARLSELRKEVRRIARARIELSQEQSRHAEAVRRDRAEIEALRAELTEREQALRRGEPSSRHHRRVVRCRATAQTPVAFDEMKDALLPAPRLRLA